jgi:hypothetical protein
MITLPYALINVAKLLPLVNTHLTRIGKILINLQGVPEKGFNGLVSRNSAWANVMSLQKSLRFKDSYLTVKKSLKIYFLGTKSPAHNIFDFFFLDILYDNR